LQPANDYETRITFEGFRPLVLDAIQIQLGKITKLDFSFFKSTRTGWSWSNNYLLLKGTKTIKIDVINSLPSQCRVFKMPLKLI
jgi:hypothetical protein